jgi:hypothetical protein
MPKPTVSQVHVNRPLTNISIAYIQDAASFVADKVFPVIPVTHKSDTYYTYNRGDFNRDEATERAAGTESKGNGYALGEDSYYCRVYAFHKDIPAEVRANADPALDPDKEATMLVTQKMLIRREKVFASKYMAGGVWTRDYDGVASSPTGSQVIKWSDYGNSDPVQNIQDAATDVQKRSGFIPNTLVLSQDVYNMLKNHPDIIDRIKYSGGVSNDRPAVVSRQAMATVFDVDRILVMGAIENTADEGAAESSNFISAGKALLAYTTSTPGLMTPTAGYIFNWKRYADFGITVDKFYMRSKKVDRVEAEMAFDAKLVSADLGAFWDAII